MKSFYRVKLKEKKKLKKDNEVWILVSIWTSCILFHQIYHSSHTSNTWNLILVWCVDIHFWLGKALSPTSNICLEEGTILLIAHTQGEGIEQRYDTKRAILEAAQHCGFLLCWYPHSVEYAEIVISEKQVLGILEGEIKQGAKVSKPYFGAHLPHALESFS